MFSEMLHADYTWATLITVEGIPGLSGIMDLSSRHPHGNAGAFCDGHAEMIDEDQIRDPLSPFWKVTRK